MTDELSSIELGLEEPRLSPRNNPKSPRSAVSRAVSQRSESKSQTTFQRSFTAFNRQYHVKEADEVDEGSPEDQVCVFGSAAHIAALRNRSADLRDQLAEAQARKKEMEILYEDLLTEASGVGQEINELEGNTEIAKEDVKHVTEGNFGPIQFREPERKQKTFDPRRSFWRRVFRRPRPNQYFHKQVLVRDNHHRTASWNELFFDLVFVAVIALLGHDFIGKNNAEGLNEFALLYMPVYKIWIHIHFWLNRWSRGDLFHRIYILFAMGIVVLMAANAEAAFRDDPTVFIGAYMCFQAVHTCVRLANWTLNRNFRHIITWQILHIVGSLVIWGIAMAVPRSSLKLMFWIGNSWDQLLYVVWTFIGRSFQRRRHDYQLALNIEHATERVGLFTIVVLGETIVAMLNGLVSDEARVGRQYAAALCALSVGICYQWIYFDIDASRKFIHAIRRSALTGLMWNLLHIPLHIALVVGGTSISLLMSVIKQNENHASSDEGIEGVALPPLETYSSLQTASISPKFTTLASSGSSHIDVSAARWFFSSGFGVAMLVMTAIGLLHKSLDKDSTVTIPARFRLALRAIIGLVMVIVPVMELDALDTILVVAALSVVITVVESYGRMERFSDKAGGDPYAA